MEGPESDQQRSKRQDLSEKALDEGEDPLDWLRPRRPQFPSLWRLARKYLCVLATSTEAERLFSWTGFMLNKRRLSLSGESMSMQLKDNIKLWSFNGALVFASKYNHRHAHAIALHMRKPLPCACTPHCFSACAGHYTAHVHNSQTCVLPSTFLIILATTSSSDWSSSSGFASLQTPFILESDPCVSRLGTTEKLLWNT